MKPCLMNGKWELWLPEHRADRREWTTPPYWEPERIDAMHAVIGPDDVVYDVGAEEADMSALWASWGARVVLIEPNPKVWPNIRAIFDCNDLAGHVEAWFVGFCGDQLRLRPEWDAEHVHPPHLGWPRCAWGPVIGDHGFLALPERPDCPVTTVDLLAGHFGPPTVVTIDVEGAELSVLRGAADVLATYRPRVFVSVHLDMPWIDRHYPGDTGDALDAFMVRFGYEGRHLATDHESHWEYRHPEGR